MTKRYFISLFISGLLTLQSCYATNLFQPLISQTQNISEESGKAEETLQLADKIATLLNDLISLINNITARIDSLSIVKEIKKSNTPDWMQCIIKFNNKTKKWEATKKGKIPLKCRELFNKLINNINLYDGEIPPFMEKSITHEEWINIKKETNKWDDKYITIPSDSISRLYQEKGCNYIQISDGYGLYHLGKDICDFGVPLFNIEQQIRIRTKIHTRKNKKGFCCLSVVVACQPKDIKKLSQSKYSLDNKDKLPPLLIYKL